ncbi:MAG: MarR family transcriptional regulator [Dehalococcoidales bacterium]|nr:MarR family transcriptional regulator [Dehalococcoidales bacterium]
MTDGREELIKEIIKTEKEVRRYLSSKGPDAWLALNLTIAQLKSLLFIRFEGSTNFKMLAEALKVSPPNVTGIVDRLVVQELVSREDNPQNRRMQILKATEKGKELIKDLMDREETLFHATLTKMETKDLEDLHNGMSALLSASQQNIEEESDYVEG